MRKVVDISINMIYILKYQKYRNAKGEITMLEIDANKMKRVIEKSGLKQKYVSERIGMTETQFSLAISGKRRFEAGEYANVCKVLGVPMNEFLKVKVT